MVYALALEQAKDSFPTGYMFFLHGFSAYLSDIIIIEETQRYFYKKETPISTYISNR
jgi:hypothetical protein